MDDKLFNDFLIKKEKWVLYAIKAYLIQVLYFLFALEAFITLNFEKVCLNTLVHFHACHKYAYIYFSP